MKTMSNRYHPSQPRNWFLQRPGYVKFMVRELTAVFVGAYLIFLLVLLGKLAGGPEVFASILSVLKSPLSVVLHLVILLAALFHSFTWFNLTPKALPFFLGEKRIADPLVAVALGYLPWIVISVLIVWSVSG